MEYVSSLHWQQDIPVWKETDVLVVGVRESRRIIGVFVLKGADMKQSVRHDDDVFLSGNRFDTHVGSRVIYENVANGEPYGIPYRVFCPRRWKTCWWPDAAYPATRSASPRSA